MQSQVLHLTGHSPRQCLNSRACLPSVRHDVLDWQGMPSCCRGCHHAAGDAIMQGMPSCCRGCHHAAGDAIMLQGMPPCCRGSHHAAGDAIMPQGMHHMMHKPEPCWCCTSHEPNVKTTHAHHTVFLGPNLPVWARAWVRPASAGALLRHWGWKP